MIRSQRGSAMIIFNGYLFSKSKMIRGKTYWSCRYQDKSGYCKARLTTSEHEHGINIDYTNIDHTHPITKKLRDIIAKAN